MMEELRSSETSVLTRVARCHTPEDGILQVVVFISHHAFGEYREKEVGFRKNL
jgi:hypothetical protein